MANTRSPGEGTLADLAAQIPVNAHGWLEAAGLLLASEGPSVILSVPPALTVDVARDCLDPMQLEDITSSVFLLDERLRHEDLAELSADLAVTFVHRTRFELRLVASGRLFGAAMITDELQAAVSGYEELVRPLLERLPRLAARDALGLDEVSLEYGERFWWLRDLGRSAHLPTPVHADDRAAQADLRFFGSRPSVTLTSWIRERQAASNSALGRAERAAASAGENTLLGKWGGVKWILDGDKIILVVDRDLRLRAGSSPVVLVNCEEFVAAHPTGDPLRYEVSTTSFSGTVRHTLSLKLLLDDGEVIVPIPVEPSEG